MDTEDAKYDVWMAGTSPTLNVGERVILTVPDPLHDGRRGVIQEAHPGGVYDVRFDDSSLVLAWLGRNRLEREADYPDYPRPQRTPSAGE